MIFKAEGGLFGEKAPKSRQRGGKDGCRKYATKMKNARRNQSCRKYATKMKKDEENARAERTNN